MGAHDHTRLLEQVKGFAWDEANVTKNWERHQVTHIECEEVFFNNPLVIRPDETHSQEEDRFIALGRTELDRKLFIVFTIRAQKLRVISARDMNKKERKWYR